MKKMTQHDSLGNISILVLIVGLVMSMSIGGLVTFAATQYTASRRSVSLQEAVMIAESGVQYYRWHLAHNPDDYWDGNPPEEGAGPFGPYVHAFTDPQGDIQGYYSLMITPPDDGSSITTITSTGWTTAQPEVKRTVNVLFGVPSLAEYSFLHNTNAWFGTGITVYGKVHSNGGIRQDGINTSTMQSSKETYTCGLETGCNPSEQKPGVWGSGGPSELWEFPVTAVDFDSISVDFNVMKAAAESDGVYLGPSGSRGYHFTFKDDGTVDIYKVTKTQRRRGYSTEFGCEDLNQSILKETLIGNYGVSEERIFFVEDTVWLEGVVNGKATVVAAEFPIDTKVTNIWIPDSLTYLAKDGNHSLGIIAQHDIYFGVDVPNVFEINGVLLAQKGKVYRHHYKLNWCGNYNTAVRDELIIYGSVISNEKSGWNWGSAPDSGFETREVTYDSNQLFDPPPYFPTWGEYEFIFWEEVNSR